MLSLRDYQSRIQVEKAIVARELPQFRFSQSENDCCFIGQHTTSTRHNCYQLKLVLGKYYPDEMPKLFVTSPPFLFNYHYTKTISSLGVSHAFHTLRNGPDGCVQICHFKQETWDSSRTCVGALIKGILWCDAYDVHLTTGKDIAEILSRWENGRHPRLSDILQDLEWMHFRGFPRSLFD